MPVLRATPEFSLDPVTAGTRLAAYESQCRGPVSDAFRRRFVRSVNGHPIRQTCGQHQARCKQNNEQDRLFRRGRKPTISALLRAMPCAGSLAP